MRQKALLLGAVPPVIGPWVPINEMPEGTILVETRPVLAELNGQIQLMVESPEGVVKAQDVSQKVTGSRVYASVATIPGVEIISVFIED